MKLTLLTTAELSQIYHHYMENDFPPSERKPWKRILELTEQKLCYGIGLYHKDNLTGYALLIVPDDFSYCLLDYFAVLSVYRGKGYGHKFFSLLPYFFKQHFPQITEMFIECESIASSQNISEENIRSKRIAFYENCGCQTTDLHSCLFGVTYDILLLSLLSDNTLPDNLLSHVNQIYRTMFKPHHYETQVRLWT